MSGFDVEIVKCEWGKRERVGREREKKSELFIWWFNVLFKIECTSLSAIEVKTKTCDTQNKMNMYTSFNS